MAEKEWIVQMDNRQRFRGVPSDVREAQHQSVFNPWKISIGPYHHNSPSLQSGQNHKERCLRDYFLDRNAHKKLEDYVDALAPMVDELRDAYDQLDTAWLDERKKGAVLRMMVVDGSFLLEIMLQARDGEICDYKLFDHNEMDIYKRDMLLFENQIPLKVLAVLLAVQHPELDQSGIERLLTGTIAIFFSLELWELDKHMHLLHCYHRNICRQKIYLTRTPRIFSRKKQEDESPKSVDIYIPSATELQEAQIEIRTSETSILMDISSAYPTLMLPKITVDYTTKSIFHNLILVERYLSEEDMSFVTSYICFMSRLLKRAQDSNLLLSRGIIITTLQNAEVVELFAGLRKTIASSPNIRMDADILEVGERMRRHCNRNMPNNPLPARIYRVPSDVREGHDPSVFNPWKIAIGPYHHHNPSLKSGNHLKEVCLGHFLRRNVHKRFEDYVAALDPMVDELRDAYEQLESAWLDKYKKDDFLRVMVVDGCYLLEIMLQARDGVICDSKLFDHNEMDNYRCDMLLFENQIPLKVLAALISIVEQQHDFGFLIDLILHFFSLPQVWVSEFACRHILDVCRQSIIKTELSWIKDAHGFTQKSFTHIHFNLLSATKLQDAYIGIGTSRTQSLMDVSLTPTTLRLPQIDVQDAVKSIFDKVIFFERFCPHVSKCFSSYIYFMSGLLKSVEDSSLLRSYGIINTMLSDHEVVRLFHELCKNIKFSPEVRMEPEFLKVGRRLRERYNKNREPWRKDLLQTYLRSPWAFISVIAAFIIFILSIVQTVYTVLSYYNRK